MNGLVYQKTSCADNGMGVVRNTTNSAAFAHDGTILTNAMIFFLIFEKGVHIYRTVHAAQWTCRRNPTEPMGNRADHPGDGHKGLPCGVSAGLCLIAACMLYSTSRLAKSCASVILHTQLKLLAWKKASGRRWIAKMLLVPVGKRSDCGAILWLAFETSARTNALACLASSIIF